MQQSVVRFDLPLCPPYPARLCCFYCDVGCWTSNVLDVVSLRYIYPTAVCTQHSWVAYGACVHAHVFGCLVYADRVSLRTAVGWPWPAVINQPPREPVRSSGFLNKGINPIDVRHWGGLREHVRAHTASAQAVSIDLDDRSPRPLHGEHPFHVEFARCPAMLTSPCPHQHICFLSGGKASHSSSPFLP